jgi:non-heme chloroperoxidase
VARLAHQTHHHIALSVRMGKSVRVAVKSVDITYSVVKKSGYILDGTITVREGEKHQGPIIIFAHGTLSSGNHNFTDELTQKLSNELGMRSYRFNFRFDKSDAEPEHRYKYSGYEDDISDLEAVVASLRADGYIPWCFFGHSRGSNDVLMYAARHTQGRCESPELLGESKSDVYANDDICAAATMEFDRLGLALVVAAPRYDMTCMSSTIFSAEQIQSAKETGSAVWPTQRGDLQLRREDLVVTDSLMDMGKVVSNIPAEVPILLLHGTDDELIPVHDAHAYQKARSSVDVSIIDGARHAFRGKKQNKALLSTVTEWLAAKYPNIVLPPPSRCSSHNNLAELSGSIRDVTLQD